MHFNYNLHLQSIRWIPHLQFPPPLSFIYIFPLEHYTWLGVQIWKYASLLDDITSQPLAISMEDVLSTIPHQGLNHASFGPHSACTLWIHVQTKLKNIKCALHNLKVFHIYILFPLSFESFHEQHIYCLFLFLFSHLVPSCRRESLWNKIHHPWRVMETFRCPQTEKGWSPSPFFIFTFLGFAVALSYFI